MSFQARPTKAEVVTDFRRAQILDAAREVFGRQGIPGTTVDGIARRAGVAKGTVYLYYRSKEDILWQVLDEDLTEMHARTVPVVAGATSLEQALTAFFSATLTFFDQKRDFFEQAVLHMTPELRRKARQKVLTVHKAQMDAWREALMAARASGHIDAVDADAAAATIVAFAGGLAKQRLRGWTETPVATTAEQACALIWKGLARR